MDNKIGERVCYLGLNTGKWRGKKQLSFSVYVRITLCLYYANYRDYTTARDVLFY